MLASCATPLRPAARRPLRRLRAPRAAALRRGCAATLPRDGPAGLADPTPAGLAPPWAAAEYDGRGPGAGAGAQGAAPARAPGARSPELLAGAVRRRRPCPAVRSCWCPVPSRPASVRARGHDPTDAIYRGGRPRACGAGGHDAWPLRCCACGPASSTRPGSTPAERAANLAGSMACPTGRLRRLAARAPSPAGGLRRRAHHRRHGPGGAAGAGGGRAAGGRRRRGRGDPSPLAGRTAGPQ